LETEFLSGANIISVHSPDDALLWLETHHDDTLLDTMRTHGLGGPIAAMLSPEIQALVVFGSILDGWVLKAAKLLADVSHFSVIIRPFSDDPTGKWSSEGLPDYENPDDTDPPSTQNTSSSNVGVNDTASISGSEDSIESSSDNDSDDLDLGGGVFRLRGGAGKTINRYTPWSGPVHNLDIHLELRPTPELGYKVMIRSKIQVWHYSPIFPRV
jgi:hypothetical protein